MARSGFSAFNLKLANFIEQEATYIPSLKDTVDGDEWEEFQKNELMVMKKKNEANLSGPQTRPQETEEEHEQKIKDMFD